MKPVRPETYRKGLWAESLAALLLRSKGYRILARRFRSPLGEIDLIARRGNRLCFVEVKVRGSAADGAWSITPRQQQRIARCAQAWLARNPKDCNREITFDVVLLAPRSWPRHLSDAFRI